MEQLVSTDDKGRMSLGKSYAKMYFLMHKRENGNIELVKAAIIPEKELWLHYNPKAKKSVLLGIEQAKEGKGKKNAINLDAYDEGQLPLPKKGGA